MGPRSVLYRLKFVQEPLVGAAQETGGRLFEDGGFMGNLEDPQSGGVAGLDDTVFVEGENGIVHAGEDALGVVHLALNVVEELGVLDAHRDLRGKGGQPFLVLGVEGPSSLIEHLAYADRLARLAEDRHAEDRPGEKAGLLVEGRVEAQIGIGVGYVFALV